MMSVCNSPVTCLQGWGGQCGALISMIAAHIGIHDDEDNWRAARCIVNHNEVLGRADVQ